MAATGRGGIVVRMTGPRLDDSWNKQRRSEAVPLGPEEGDGGSCTEAARLWR